MKNFLLKLRSDKAHYLFFAVSISFFIFLNFWKIKYGFKGWDESFYITIPHRILQGDALFKDEWHLSQLSGFLRIPFVWIYELVTKSTEGIVLFIRVCYVVFHAVVSVFAYIRLRKYGYVAAVSMLLYFIFTPFDIMALSYNTMGMDFLVVTGVTMATADTSKKLPFILSGISFSAVVLCCPFMALVYVLFAFGVLSNKIFVEKKRSKIICRIFIIVMGLCVPNIASFIFTYLLAAEIYKESNPKKIVKSLKIIVISLFVFYTCFQGLLETYVKIYHCYGEDGNTLTLNYMIDKGPAKGIYTNEENYNHYNALYDDVVVHNNHEGKKVLFVTKSTWTYLAAYKTRNAALSAWLWIYFYDECFERMRDYYSVNEDKIPDYIYIEKSTFNLSDKASLFDELEKNGYEMTENDISYMFEKK